LILYTAPETVLEVKPAGHSKNEKTQDTPLLGEVRFLGLGSARSNVEEASFFKT
jgi:hypothetical protein